MQDSLPAGASIVSFQILVHDASIQPSGAGAAVSLGIKDADIELTHLQSEPALIGSLNVPAATYNSITVTFSNPRPDHHGNPGCDVHDGGSGGRQHGVQAFASAQSGRGNRLGAHHAVPDHTGGKFSAGVPGAF
jgi:hypothetical protein